MVYCLWVYDQQISSNGSISVSVRVSALSVTPGPAEPLKGIYRMFHNYYDTDIITYIWSYTILQGELLTRTHNRE